MHASWECPIGGVIGNSWLGRVQTEQQWDQSETRVVECYPITYH